MSYGALTWLSDITVWGAGVAAALKPGGRIVLVEFHPMLDPLYGVLNENWAEAYDHLGEKHYAYAEGVGDYVVGNEALILTGATVEDVPAFHNPHPAHEFSWGVAEK